MALSAIFVVGQLSVVALGKENNLSLLLVLSLSFARSFTRSFGIFAYIDNYCRLFLHIFSTLLLHVSFFLFFLLRKKDYVVFYKIFKTIVLGYSYSIRLQHFTIWMPLEISHSPLLTRCLFVMHVMAYQCGHIKRQYNWWFVVCWSNWAHILGIQSHKLS